MRRGMHFVIIALMLVICMVAVAFMVINSDIKKDTLKEDVPKVAMNGKGHSWEDMAADFSLKTVDGNTGISLSDIVNASGIVEKSSKLYEIASSEDGYNKTVTWGFMLRGILMKEDFTTYFPDLPGRYKIKNTGKICIDQYARTIIINGAELTQNMPFDRWFNTTEINGTEGIPFAALLDYSGIQHPEMYNYTITAHDGYSQTVNWTAMSEGLYVQEDFKAYFLRLDKKYHIKNIKEINPI